MHISNKAMKLIKNFEGFSSKPYLCPGGYKTIGYGHVIHKDEDINYLSRREAAGLLEEDIARAENSVKRHIRVKLTQGQFDALVSFTFNLGSAALQRSTLKQKVNREEHEDVPREFFRWIYAGGIALVGLMRRRELEAEIYAS